MFLNNQNITSNAWYYQTFYLIKMKHSLAKFFLLKLSFFIFLYHLQLSLGYKNSILFYLCYATFAPFNGIVKIQAFITVNIPLLKFQWKYFVTREQAEILIPNLLNKKF